MFMTCFGEVGFWIANGVGGGLNSMSAFKLSLVPITLFRNSPCQMSDLCFYASRVQSTKCRICSTSFLHRNEIIRWPRGGNYECAYEIGRLLYFFPFQQT